MAELFGQPLVLGVYLTAAVLLSLRADRSWSIGLTALVNAAAVYLIFFHDPQDPTKAWHFVTYVALLAVQFLTLRTTSKYFPRGVLVAVWLPLALLFLTRFLPSLDFADYSVYLGSWVAPVLGYSGLHDRSSWIGLSYVAFRLSLMAIEVRNESVAMPSLARFFAYAFFLPHFMVGPISPYRGFAERFDGLVRRTSASVYQGFLRITVGLVKFYFISGLVYQMTFTRRFPVVTSLSWGEFVTSLTAYSVYIYFNFSGFCDVMIGTSALLGIETAENFNSPLLATDIRAFWARWHMSLTEYLRLLIFNPIVKLGAARGGARGLKHSVPLATILVMALMGVWHGTELHYLIFAALHAAGLIAFHYLPRSPRLPRPVTWAITFAFISICFYFFENDWPRALNLWRAVQSSGRT